MFTRETLKLSFPSSSKKSTTEIERKATDYIVRKLLKSVKHKSVIVTKGVLNYEWEIDIEFEDDFPESFATTEKNKARAILLQNGFATR